MLSPRTPALLMLLLSACTSVEITRHVPQDVAGTSARPASEAPASTRTIPILVTPPPPSHPPAPAPSISIPRQAPVPTGPLPVTACDPGGCWSNGQRYDGGTGGAYLDKNGKLCQGNGTWMQCF